MKTDNLLSLFFVISYIHLFLCVKGYSIIIEEEECKNNAASKTFLVKIGGSCITKKGEKETLNQEILEWFSTAIAQTLFQNEIRNNNDDSRSCREKVNYILVHGAGSFGHFTAKEYGIRSQTTSPPDSSENQQYLMQGVAKTRLSVQTLNHHVISSLIEKNISAIGISPWFGHPCPVSTPDLLFEESLRHAVVSALEAGLVPILHGDACLYSKSTGAGIIGGDALLEILSKVLEDTQAVFITDVPGIFTSNPKLDPNATLVTQIQVDQKSGILLDVDVNATESSHKHDVTGGIAGKLGSAISLVRLHQTPVAIVQCGTSDALQAIKGQDFEIGTKVILAQN